MNKKIFILLSFIVIIASLLRFWGLGKVPASPDWDEVALGYNAYSIMQTGKDEYGKAMPIILRSFDDYKPALYAYLTIPSIQAFGLNVFAVRLPSAIFGVLMVIGVFFLVKELFKKDNFALLSAFLLAISPWHIQFSRVAFESGVGAALNVFWILFFIKGLKKAEYLILSALIMGLNLYMYQSEKVFIPLVLMALIYIFRKEFFAINRKYIVTSLVVLVIISLPLIHFTLTNKEALARARGVSIFSDNTLVERNSQKLIQDHENKDILGLVLDNRRVEYARGVVSGYLSHFDFNWLFITGDLARHHAPNMGLMYLWELPFLLVGIYSLAIGKFSQNFGKKEKLFIFVWFLLVPIPASITSGVPHAVRTLNFLPLFQIFTAVGILAAIKEVSSIKYQVLSIRIKYLAFGVSFLFLIFNFLYYLNQYFVQQNYFTSEEWQYGYEKAIPFIQNQQDKYDKIVVSNSAPLDQSYMFFLFYLKYDPSLYKEETKNSSGGFRENHKFGKYEFRPIVWDKENNAQKILYVGRDKDFPPQARRLFQVNYLNGSPAISIVER
ncbi:MAG: glycosyltransferase family 39 protein [Candidatus Levybacteria bacterium]|nr:glycosyltransferase family 39 protein [Candidatus Levybacteria bacterium]